MLKDDVFHEDVGYGMVEYAKKEMALNNCKKAAVTDGLKRTSSHSTFGLQSCDVPFCDQRLGERLPRFNPRLVYNLFAS
ncbi:hypothetical protein B0H19DRAFT_1157299, partial [Mycena capillaripes]